MKDGGAHTENEARDLDEKDPLKKYRNFFHIPQSESGEDCVYLAGNSLGLQPKTVKDYIDQELKDWATLGVEGHFHAKNPWLPYHESLTGAMSRVVGADPVEVVVMNSLTVNLHLMLVSFYRPSSEKFKIIIEGGAFPSDRYAVVSHLKFHGYTAQEALIELVPRPGENTLRTEDILSAIEKNGSKLALVLLGDVNYLTGQAYDLPAIAHTTHLQKSVFGVDLAHGAGNLLLKLHDWQVDFAVWCSYKYLNSGPGGVAGCFVHEKHQAAVEIPRFAGWWGHNKETRFKMGPDFDPLLGAEGWQLSNPPIFQLASLRASLEIFDRATMKELRAKGDKLTGYLQALIEFYLKDNCEIVTPKTVADRGSQLSLRFKGNPKEKLKKLNEANVICDFREPDIIRVAPTPLYNTFHDAWIFVQSMRKTVSLNNDRDTVTLVGAGPVGSLLALFLAQKNYNVEVLERRPDMRVENIGGGRSINLALSTRGLHALKQVGLESDVLKMAIPMLGRMVHAVDGKTNLQRYGKDDSQYINSVSRGDLNRLLMTAAEKTGSVELKFNHRVVKADFERNVLDVEVIKSSGPVKNSTITQHKFSKIIGTDGSASVIRKNICHDDHENILNYGYKELHIPPSKTGDFQMERNALHIWPRGTYMLIALPNEDASFTATLFLPLKGALSFESLKTPGDVEDFFKKDFGDVLDIMPDISADFFKNPVGQMVTVKCSPWNFKDRGLILGDAAHAMVPFLVRG